MSRMKTLTSSFVVVLLAITIIEGAFGSELPKSTVLIRVISLDENATEQHRSRIANQEVKVENTIFAVTARIEAIISTRHGLEPGAVIKVKGTAITWDPPVMRFRNSRPLRPGEVLTITIFAAGRDKNGHQQFQLPGGVPVS